MPVLIDESVIRARKDAQTAPWVGVSDITRDFARSRLTMHFAGVVLLTAGSIGAHISHTPIYYAPSEAVRALTSKEDQHAL